MNYASIDFLIMRIMGYDTPLELIEYFLQLNPNDFVSCKPDYHYRNALKFGHITVYYNGNLKMGMCIEMTGQGCKEYCDLQNDPGAIIRLFHCLGPADAVTKLDLAYDDMEGKLDLSLIKSKACTKEIRTRSQDIRSLQNLNGKNGYTLYVGSSKSEYSIRIYNKAAESHCDEHWVRAEEVLRKPLANLFVRQFTASIDPDTSMEEQLALFFEQGAQLFLKRVAFIERTDSNISRCPVSHWWAEFLETATPLQLSTSSPRPDSDASKHWLERVVAPSLAAEILILGPEFLIKLILMGIRANLKPNSNYVYRCSCYRAAGRSPAMELRESVGLDCLQAIYAAIGQYLEKNTVEGGETDA